MTADELTSLVTRLKAALVAFSGWSPERVTIRAAVSDEHLDFEVLLDGQEVNDDDLVIVERFFSTVQIGGESAEMIDATLGGSDAEMDS